MSQPFEDSLQSLKEMPGVLGVMLARQQRVVSNFFPKAISSGRIDQLAQCIHELMGGYRAVDREVDQVCISLNGGTVLVVGHEDATLAFLLDDISGLPFLGSTGLTFLRDNYSQIDSPTLPARATESADPALWADYRKRLLAMMGKVMGSSQAEKLLARVIKSMGADPDEGLAQPRFRELGVSLIIEIPNRAKQTALRPELDEILHRYK